MVSVENNIKGLRVFISYPRGGAGHSWAEKIHMHLEGLGVDVWRDEQSIDEGDDNWYRCIKQGLEQSDVLVCVVGHDTDHCRWQEREILHADQLKKQLVVLRITKVDLPLCIKEKQPIESHADQQQTLNKLTRKLAEIQPQSTAPQSSISPQRQYELDYLNTLIHIDYSDREKRYVPVEANKHRSNSPERAMQVRVDADVLLRAFNKKDADTEQTEEKPYKDALEAYRDLKDRQVRRLVVLGEPGAGKSFSLERIAVEYTQQALSHLQAPIPLLIPLGLWTREDMLLENLIENQLGKLGRYFKGLREQQRAVLLLDGMNEIPPGQRKHKVDQIKRLAKDERFVSVVVSCREKDFVADCHLPFDTLALQPLKPTQIRSFLTRALSLHYDRDAAETADNLFWQLAGGDGIRQVWRSWCTASEDLDLFWHAEEIPADNPNVTEQLSWEQEGLWKAVRFNPRNLLRLASNPYLLHVITVLQVKDQVPDSRADLFKGFLQVLYNREQQARGDRHDSARIPAWAAWEAALVDLAETLQRAVGTQETDGAQTALPLAQRPASLTDALIDFSIDASVLQINGEAIRFTHQLLQEYLASRILLEASRSGGKGGRSAYDFWPQERWWERTGWEVVAEIAAESCDNDIDSQVQLIAWLAKANPEVACEVWQHLGQLNMPSEVLTAISKQWFARMTDVNQAPCPLARAAIGRALGNWGLDRRRGVGLRADGLPDIDWVEISSTKFVYQESEHPPLPAFYIARHLITNAQFQAFIDAGGYQDDQWWQGLDRRIASPTSPQWNEPNAPRETVNWFEAIAFCRWLSTQSGLAVNLPTEQQWERAARGMQGLKYPWGNEFQEDFANCDLNLRRTSAVGLYPHAASPEGILDMAGNVWEWCLNEYETPGNCQLSGDEARVLRRGSWSDDPVNVRSLVRLFGHPLNRGSLIGFRVLCSSPIE